MPWYGSGRTMSGLAELMSISLLKPTPWSRNVRARPARSGGSGDASKLRATSSPGFETTNASSAAASSGRTSPSRV